MEEMDVAEEERETEEWGLRDLREAQSAASKIGEGSVDSGRLDESCSSLSSNGSCATALFDRNFPP